MTLMPVLRRNRGLGRFRDEMDDLFTRFFYEPSGDLLSAGTVWPAMDISETEDGITVRAELPGMKSDDIDISVQGNVLTISGEKKQETEDRKEGYYHSERTYGRFQRTVSLPSEVDPDNIKATQNDGVLTISLPKSEAAKPKRIKVKSE